MLTEGRTLSLTFAVAEWVLPAYNRRMASDSSVSRYPRLRRWGRRVAIVFGVSGVLLGARFFYAFRDRTGGYSLNLDIVPSVAATTSSDLRVGFGRVDITPVVTNASRPVWLAGFSQNRAATGVHDPLQVNATVIEDGPTRVGIAVLDSIGFFYDDVIEVRRACQEELKLSYVIVCSTHNHSTPDLMGLWGPNPWTSGIDPNYRKQVIQSAARAFKDAVASLQPAHVSLHEIKTPPDGLVADTRKPQVFDSDLRVMLFRNTAGTEVLGSIVGWGNHPETPWSRNTDITADFPGVLREALENGIIHSNRVVLPGLGGTHVFVNGAVGGLMTTHPSTTVTDPFLGTEHKKPSHEKTRALGHQLARRILDRVSLSKDPGTHRAPIHVHARTVHFPIENKGFLLATFLGILDRGHSKWMHMKSEVAVLRIGEASIACVPGEIYPEIVNGGVERAPGGDFDVEPVEVPPVREFLPGRVKFLFGLANDEIGYIVPRSEWDEKAPYLYGAKGAPYGEVNSVGPQTAPLLHQVLKTLSDLSR